MPWWSVVLLVVGVCGGIPSVVFVVLVGREAWEERRFDRSAERRAEDLALRYRGETTTQPRPSVGTSGLREAIDAAGRAPRSGPPDSPPHPHQGWRT